VVAFPRADGTVWEIKIPWVLGIITTRSFDKQVPGINDLVIRAEDRIRNGLIAYEAMEVLKADRQDPEARAAVMETWPDLGYALLLKKYRVDIENATEAEIAQAAQDTVPDVWPLFWSFRLMAGIGF